jgi:lipopolysaccharide export LptBFGC system permease protein LptF
MGRGGIVHPAFAAWIPNLSVFLVGLGLLQVRNR